MGTPFDFLAKARPAGLYRLLEKLPLADAACVLAGLPPGVGVQVMAYFPESRQAELVPALREARQASPEQSAAAAAKVRELLIEAKGAAGDASSPPRPRRETTSVQAAGDGAASPPARREGPTAWVPRTAGGSPINGPAQAGQPPVAGDPLKSPLARAGLLDLISRAQEKFLPGTKKPAARSAAPAKAAGLKVTPAAPPPRRPAERPAAREGVVSLRSVGMNRTPRVIGPVAAAGSAGGEARRMDGKALLAAILRQAGADVRDNVRHDDPGLYRELKGRMFYFDDLALADDNALARVFTAAPADESALALKFAAPALRDRVLRVVSPGRAKVLADSPTRVGLDAVEAAQKKVLGVALQLQAAGRILIDPRDPDLA